jgi:aminoglycoside 3-N-acetyltransferase
MTSIRSSKNQASRHSSEATVVDDAVRSRAALIHQLADDTFWRRPGVQRSDSPHAFAAEGPLAAEITRPHPLDVPHGPDSPIGRVHERDGRVLLLGVGHDANTTIHLAESLAGVRYRRHKYLTVLRDGQPTRYEYDEIDHCCENFALLDDWLEVAGRQVRGTVGRSEARLMRSRHVVEAALAKLRANEMVFLHPTGVCDQCDEARAHASDGRRKLNM